jgi:hypothetical protein
MWKQIKDTRYEVSIKGEVRNSETLRVLAQYKHKKGYMTTGLTTNGSKKTYLTHRLVAEAFLSDYTETVDVNHKNGVRSDNNLSNLECLSRKDNNADRVFSSYYLNEIDMIIEIIKLHTQEMSSEEIYVILREKARVKQSEIRTINKG